MNNKSDIRALRLQSTVPRDKNVMPSTTKLIIRLTGTIERPGLTETH